MQLSPNSFLIAVVGGKGGVGKSVFAANFAIAIAAELRAQVLLIDADSRSCGDQNLILGVRPNKTLSEVVAYKGPLNPTSLPQLITPHPSGIGFIGAVRGPEETLSVHPDVAMRFLEFFSRTFSFLVVDCGSEIGPLQEAVLMESTAIMVVAAPEVLVVNQTQRMINDLQSKTISNDSMLLVVNKASQSGLNPQAVIQALRLQAIGMLPLDESLVAASLQKSQPFVMGQRQSPLSVAYFDTVRRLNSGILQKLKGLAKPKTKKVQTSSSGQNSPEASGEVGLHNSIKLRTHTELISAIDLKNGLKDIEGDKQKELQLRQKTLQTITQIIDREAASLPREDRARLIKEVLDEALGLGPLEDLLADANVTEIMVNGHKRIFVEKSGKLSLSSVTFTSNKHLLNVIERIVTPLGRTIDQKTPYVDARLKDGSRVNAVIEPLSIDGPAVTIRKFKKGGISPDQYISYGSMTKQMVDFLKICAENGLNIVISGGTGSGKTSLLNMISSFIPSSERIVTVEDAAELQLQQEHVVRLETRPANMEGSGAVGIRDLVRNALRMRPNRIIVGETRDGAALDMLQAMNTGHDGSMTTTHSNSPRECISRLETLCMMAGMDLPSRAIREQIGSAVQLIVQISRLSDGSRKVISITEVCGMQGETITLQEIFRFKETSFDKNRKIVGQFQALGRIPTFLEKLEAKGVNVPRDMFTSEAQKPVNAGSTGNNVANIKKTGTGGA